MGRHGTPDGELTQPEDPTGRAAEQSDPFAPQPDDDQLTTMGRRTRAERRREGLLPAGEDPLSGRPVRTVRPTPPARPPAAATPPAVPPPVARPARAGGPTTSAVPIPQPVPPGRPSPAGDDRDTAPPVSGSRTSLDPSAPAGRVPGTSGLPGRAATPGPATPAEQPVKVARPTVPPLPAAVVRDLPAADRPPVRPPSAEQPRTAPGPATGPGRAAGRAERQAADAVRRREERRRGVTTLPTPDEDERPRGSRVLVLGLVAVVVVALVLLSVWSFSRPATEEASASRSATSASAPAPATSAAPGTTASAPVTTAAPVATGPVFAPVSVLNSAGINGLAADVGDALTAGGWEIRTLGVYSSQDVATTTVYYTDGDVTQQQAATSLVAQFPDVSGPVPRFFEIPDLPDPGIVVIATGSWQP